MPILSQEVSLYPQNLLGVGSADQVHNWYIVYTRARHEKSLARHMLANTMHFYLPLVAKEQFVRGKRVHSYLPVFSSYLFYCGDAPDEVSKVAPYCVSCVFPVDDQKRLQTELLSIHTLLEAGSGMTLESRLTNGRKVRVKSGALRGLEGTVVRRKNRSRLLVAVNYLQQGVSVEIDDFMLETI